MEANDGYRTVDKIMKDAAYLKCITISMLNTKCFKGAWDSTFPMSHNFTKFNPVENRELPIKLLYKHNCTTKYIILYLWINVSYDIVVFKLVSNDDYRTVRNFFKCATYLKCFTINIMNTKKILRSMEFDIFNGTQFPRI